MEKSLIEIEHEAYQLRNAYIRANSRAFARFLKRKLASLSAFGSGTSAAQAK